MSVSLESGVYINKPATSEYLKTKTRLVIVDVTPETYKEKS